MKIVSKLSLVILFNFILSYYIFIYIFIVYHISLYYIIFYYILLYNWISKQCDALALSGIPHDNFHPNNSQQDNSCTGFCYCNCFYTVLLFNIYFISSKNIFSNYSENFRRSSRTGMDLKFDMDGQDRFGIINSELFGQAWI